MELVSAILCVSWFEWFVLMLRMMSAALASSLLIVIPFVLIVSIVRGDV